MKKQLPPCPCPGTDAFALVLTLLILSVLAIVAVSFLASMGAERATANAFANRARAEQAARAGADSAMAVLKAAFQSYPDSATVWDTTQTSNTDGTNNEGTSLYLHAIPGANGPDPTADNRPARLNANTTADPRKIFVLPLVSGVTDGAPKPWSQKSTAVPAMNLTVTDPAQQTFINLNNPRSANDTQGWIGSPPGTPLKSVRAPWVEFKSPLVTDPNATDPNKLVTTARYAYWIEDESFRANINYAGLGDPTNLHQRRDNAKNLAVNSTDTDLITPLLALASTSSNTDAQSLFDTRKYFPAALFPESRAFSNAVGLNPPAYSDIETDASLSPAQKRAKALARYLDQIAYFTTTRSEALNLSRHGGQRLNLNAAVSQTTVTTDIQNQIDRIAKTIQFHTPNFGQRFYRTKWSGNPPVIAATDLNNAQMVSTANAPIYIYKIAANLRDYVDSDAIPTIVMKGGQVRQSGRPTQTINFEDGENPVWAVGKDSAPFIQECAVRFSGNVTGTPPSAYTVNVDYYIEFWNMSTRKVTGQDLGPNAFIRIVNPPVWRADNKNDVTNNPNSTNRFFLQDGSGHSLSDSREVGGQGRDFDIDISQAVFPPGAVTVITTDPAWSSAVITNGSPRSIADPNSSNQREATKHFVVCPFLPPGKRTYAGPLPPGCDEVRMRYDSSPTIDNGADYETEVLVGNGNGYIDSLAGALPMSGGVISIPVGSSPRPVYGGYLRGNLAAGSATGGLQPSAPGDPRANTEQMTFILHIPSSGPGSSVNGADQTGYKNFDLSSSSYQVPPTFGLPNIYSIAPPRPANPWPDYYWFPGNDGSHVVAGPPSLPGSNSPAEMTPRQSPAIIADSPLVSIGQLGDLYDPARLPPTNNGDIKYSRGGGRTLRIGQHDDLYDGSLDSFSSTWAAWRLTDFFSVNDNIRLPGLININGLARDNGAALKAALQGFKFQPQTGLDPDSSQYNPLMHGDAQLADRAFVDPGLQNLVSDIIDKRLKNTDATKPGPFFERGELSETPALNPKNPSPPILVTDASGNVVNMATVFDRGREELLRRLIEMTTTRGNIFTVYAVGQSISQTVPSGIKRVTSSQKLKVTFRLTPKNAVDPVTSVATDFLPATDTTGQSWNTAPNDPLKLAARFAPPHHYEIEILSSSTGGS